MASSHASTISIIEVPTVDEVLWFLPMAQRKTQENIDTLAKFIASALLEEEDSRSTIVLHRSFPEERQRQHKHLIYSMARLLVEMIACREKNEKDLQKVIEESISMEKACMKPIEQLMENGETSKNS
ncbi:uncharacterized protein EAF01_001557 [Botrytis porri]|uniref:Uncharacterized protein n=1 Tax=Botrytis porri TaxID=87229 RepID=A0A4Z1KF72_9HELO|nr:uncharacterized protein EAF01_001557 [Botrytis porri]KAF7912536.1 hypothetical protein EAF01_001557 [Botrytis porri]TGO82832.1 hypothetical protein BPOR_0749g00070 [Botrytis porri]